MIIIKDKDVYKIMWISGPAHNFLGLEFLNPSSSDCEIEVVVLPSEHLNNELLSCNIKQQVLRGLSEANSAFNTNYKLKQIQFISSDTYSSDIYVKLTMELIKRLVLDVK